MKKKDQSAPQKVTEHDMLLSALHVVLEHVDYTKNKYAWTEMVGAVLPKGVIQQAREAIRVAQSARYSQSTDDFSPKSDLPVAVKEVIKQGQNLVNALQRDNDFKDFFQRTSKMRRALAALGKDEKG